MTIKKSRRISHANKSTRNRGETWKTFLAKRSAEVQWKQSRLHIIISMHFFLYIECPSLLLVLETNSTTRHPPSSSSKYPPGVTKDKLVTALATLGIHTEHQWVVPEMLAEDVAMVQSVFQLNNISIFSAATQLGKVSARLCLYF